MLAGAAPSCPISRGPWRHLRVGGGHAHVFSRDRRGVASAESNLRVRELVITRTFANVDGQVNASYQHETSLCHLRPTEIDGHVRHVPGVSWLIVGLLAVVSAGSGLEPAMALEPLREPANALSLPTWAIHVSSVMEWWICMGLVWEIGSAGQNSSWKDFSWGMLPLLGGAMCACTWHVFYNDPELDFLVALQAALTFMGNGTLWYAASRLVRAGAQVARREQQ